VVLTTWQAGSILQIGANFAMTGGSICAGEQIVIGNHVVVGANSTILDGDFHPIDPKARRQTPNAAATLPVTIEDNVFIGMNCLILKGVTIGHDSVIGAGSIVTKDVPAGTVVAGNPAQAIGRVTSPAVT
jgi:acetyltransferase-like isoleucine patch superfamily enzyme